MNHTIPHCPCCDDTTLRQFMMLSVTTAHGLLQRPLFRCKGCDHAWLDTSEGHERIEEDYARGYVGHRIDPFFERQCRIAIGAEIRPLVPPPAALLDVGCGNGSFLLAAQEAGYDGLGIDISSEAVDLVKSRGGKAIAVDFLSYEFRQKFDVISMWDVVEHLRDPYLFLRRAKELLNPGGILIIKTPSVGKLVLWLTRVRNAWAGSLLQAPHHVHYWSPRSMTVIMHRAGFTKIIRWRPRKFRSVPETKSLCRKATRIVRNALLRGAGSRNIFCVGRAA